MTIDKFGRHISQQIQSSEDQEDFVVTSTSFERNITNGLYFNIILTFESTTFQENSKKYLISNIKTCHVFFYESAMIEFATGYPSDIVTVINEKEFSLTELVNVQLHRGDNIAFQEKDPQTTNNNLFLEFFIRVPVGKNNGYKYVLIVINCFSKFVWTEPLINKSAQEVANAMNKILQRSKKIPKNLQTDMDDVDKYNNTVHSTTRMKPVKVTARNERSLLKSTYTHLKFANKITKFKVGDHVRISKYREAFEKGYTPNWSSEIFIIRKIRLTNPTTYLLQDEAGKEITGGFYELELQKDLAVSSHVFVRHDAARGSLQPPYDGPYEVRRRSEKNYTLHINGKDVRINIERLKPAYGLTEEQNGVDIEAETKEKESDEEAEPTGMYDFRITYKQDLVNLV
ncbi:hypothetical protein NQ315_016230 [Exocentrus adspersus]|uniref:Uncharacterized protein n=1 Tax=Exocentrus adspersus TaxID=1586481 RepID=A0AAV8VJQ3_9CUCU|nr:hypothetical protein NQ315_016230 [Exocentrus adspersus]